MKYSMSVLQLTGQSQALGDGDELGPRTWWPLRCEPRSPRLHQVLRRDYPNERWVTIKWIELSLPACRGLEADPSD